MTPFQRADAAEAAYPEFTAAGARFIRAAKADGQEAIYSTMVVGNDYRNKSKLYGAFPAAFLPRTFSLFPDAQRVLHMFSGSLTAEQVEEAWRSNAILGTPAQIRLDNALHPIAKAAKPDVIGDAENAFADLVRAGVMDGLPPGNRFDLLIADSPYRRADMRRYWRESMHALPGLCNASYQGALCGAPITAHDIRYYKSSGEGVIRGHENHVPGIPGYVDFKPLNKKRVLAECHKVLKPGGWLVWLDESIPFYSKKNWIWRGATTVLRSTNHRVRVAFYLERAP